MVVTFYQNLLTKLVEEDINIIKEILENIPLLISKEDNLKLLAPFLEEEITSTFFMMDKDNDKALSYNGFLVRFFNYF